MSKGVWKPNKKAEQDLTERMVTSAITNETPDGGISSDYVDPRLYASLLFSLDSPLGGAYTIAELRDTKRRLGRVVARELPELLTENIGVNLKLARERAGITQDSAASALGISIRKLRDMERGKRTVSLNEAVMLSALYGTHIERLLGIINDEMETLLETYEAASPTLRKWIVNTVRHAQTDDPNPTSKSRDIANQDWDSHLQKLINDPETPDSVKDSILKRQ